MKKILAERIIDNIESISSEWIATEIFQTEEFINLNYDDKQWICGFTSASLMIMMLNDQKKDK